MVPMVTSEEPPSPSFKPPATILAAPTHASGSQTTSTPGTRNSPEYASNTTAFRTASSATTLRKISSTSSLSAIPNPLRIFKRSFRKHNGKIDLRKASMPTLKPEPLLSNITECHRTGLQSPSCPSLERQLSRSSDTKMPIMSFQASYDSLIRYFSDHQDTTIRENLGINSERDPKVGGNSSIVLLPNPSRSDDKAFAPQFRYDFDVESRKSQLLASNDKPIGGRNASRLGLKPATGPILCEDQGYEIETQTEIDLKRPTRLLRKVSSKFAIASGKYNTSASRCAMCKASLTSTLKTYAFPKTAPAVIATVRALYPALDSNLTNLFATSNGNRMPPSFCFSCFEELHALQICWTCGETVYRAEECVGYGWAWWHWGCMSCLLCRAPLRPPAWIGSPITLADSPACKACLRELRELVYLERRTLSTSRRQFGSPRRPELNLGTGMDGITRAGEAGSYPDIRTIGESGTVVVKRSVQGKSAALDGRQHGMHWLARKGEGGVGGGVRRYKGRSVGGKVGVGYPPLPKWMEKLPGRRSASGRVRKMEAKR